MAIKPFFDIFCWLELRLRWAHQAKIQHIADCFDWQPDPRFSCNDIHPRSQSAIDTGRVWMIALFRGGMTMAHRRSL